MFQNVLMTQLYHQVIAKINIRIFKVAEEMEIYEDKAKMDEKYILKKGTLCKTCRTEPLKPNRKERKKTENQWSDNEGKKVIKWMKQLVLKWLTINREIQKP